MRDVPEAPPPPPGTALPTVTPTVRFTDVAPRSRIAYRSNNDFTGRKYFPQPMCGGVAVFDFDGDGLQDLFFTNGAKLPELRKAGPVVLQRAAARTAATARSRT